MEGKYTDGYLKREGANAPKVEPGDMKIIGSPLDFVGLNVYTPEYVRADGSPDGIMVVQRQTSYPHMASPWLFIGPSDALGRPQCQRHLETERPCTSPRMAAPTDDQDEMDASKTPDRVMYLRNHLTHLHRAASEGYPIKGYFSGA